MTFADRLLAALGPDVVTSGGSVPEAHRHDWSGLAPVEPLALVRPRDTAGVATAVRLCHAAGVGIVPQGGRSGLCGGAHPVAGAIALSLDRMNRVVEIDAQGAVMVAEAGCVLQTAQAAAAEAGLMLAVDLGARGSCTIGGVISTNAGGNQVIRYGMARDQVLGLEAVLADGTILPAMNRLLKNNAGPDLKQLFIGSEGTLGIVTRAVLRLQARPTGTATAFCGVPGTEAVLALLGRLRAGLGPMLTSFEVMWPGFYDRMRAGIGAPHPLAADHGAYVIVEAGGFDHGTRARLETVLAEAAEAGVLADAVLAGSVREERALWAVRESVAEFGRIIGPLVAFDIGIPLSRMAEAVAGVEARIASRWPDAIVMSYGHMGDSNLHLIVSVPSAGTDQPEKAIKTLVYGLTRDLGGTVSAEHGIGLTKKDWLGHSRSEAEVATMRHLKAALDPTGILNPGKIWDPAMRTGGPE